MLLAPQSCKATKKIIVNKLQSLHE
jgi:hypothetical protein